MTWAAELEKIRRALRDPDGNLWSESFLRHLYNDVQQDFQHRTGALEDVLTQRVPGVYQGAYLQEWEWRYLPEDQRYQALSQHDDLVFCHRWEVQQRSGIAADVGDYGVHFTQPWEAFMGEVPGELIRMRFPRNFNTMKFIAYDEEPIHAASRKDIQSRDPSHVTTEGEPIAYYVVDETDNSYVLYPRPSAAFANELSGESMAYFADGDSEDSPSGDIAVRTGSLDVGEGIPVDIVDTVDNVFMVYGVSPTDMTGFADESDFPPFLRKYIRFGVVARAYSANTDGRIRSLGEYWAFRYSLGVQFTQKYLRARRQDRDYRLATKGESARRRLRHPRLPDHYPAVEP